MSTLPDQEIEKIFENIDVDGNGEIEYSGRFLFLLVNFILEFIMATLDRRKMLKKGRLTKVFNMFDKVTPPISPSNTLRMRLVRSMPRRFELSSTKIKKTMITLKSGKVL